MSSFDDIDIFDNPFRDPVYERMGFIFDEERNQYYEVIDDPQYGSIRRYYSPRDREPVPLVSEAREEYDRMLGLGIDMPVQMQSDFSTGIRQLEPASFAQLSDDLKQAMILEQASNPKKGLVPDSVMADFYSNKLVDQYRELRRFEKTPARKKSRIRIVPD